MIPPEKRVDEPPDTDEGYVHCVDFDREEASRERSLVRKKACQECGEGVPLYEPHIRVHVWVENGIGRVQKFPVFCSRACWGAWAGNP